MHGPKRKFSGGRSTELPSSGLPQDAVVHDGSCIRLLARAFRQEPTFCNPPQCGRRPIERPVRAKPLAGHGFGQISFGKLLSFSLFLKPEALESTNMGGVWGLTMSILAFALMAAQAEECRTVPVDSGGQMRQAIVCRGADGQWRERDNRTQPEPLPADFKGQIVYEGELDGIARLRPSNPNRQGQEVPYGGLVRYRAEYDGNLVTVKGEPIKAVNVGPVTLAGTRSGSTCTLFEENGSRLQVRCDRTGFAGTFSGTKPDNRGEWRLQHSIETVAVSVKSNADAAREQAQRDAEIAAARAEAQRAQEALIARMQAGKPLADRLDAIVTVDAQRWMINRYQPGSISGVTRTATGGGKGNYIVSANFSYASGLPGSIKVKMVGDRIDCVEFGDFPGECRPLGVPSSYGIASELMMSAFTSNGSSQSISELEANCKMMLLTSCATLYNPF